MNPLLTGESIPVSKQADQLLEADTPLAERSNMAFMGDLSHPRAGNCYCG